MLANELMQVDASSPLEMEVMREIDFLNRPKADRL